MVTRKLGSIFKYSRYSKYNIIFNRGLRYNEPNGIDSLIMGPTINFVELFFYFSSQIWGIFSFDVRSFFSPSNDFIVILLQQGHNL